MVESYQDEEWRELCKEASEEQDPRKLLGLLRKINDALSAQRERNPEAESAQFLSRAQSDGCKPKHYMALSQSTI